MDIKSRGARNQKRLTDRDENVRMKALKRDDFWLKGDGAYLYRGSGRT
jgi:hypothetical protein